MTQWQGFWLYLYLYIYIVVIYFLRCLLSLFHFVLFVAKADTSCTPCCSCTVRTNSSCKKGFFLHKRRGTSKFRFASCPLLQCITPKPCGFRAGEEASSTSSSKGTCCIVLLQLVFGDSVSDILVTCWPLLVSRPQADLCSAGPFDLPGLHR